MPMGHLASQPPSGLTAGDLSHSPHSSPRLGPCTRVEERPHLEVPGSLRGSGETSVGAGVKVAGTVGGWASL